MYRPRIFVASLALACLAPLWSATAESLVVNRQLDPPLPPPGTRALLRAIPADATPDRKPVESGCALLRQGNVCRAFGAVTPPGPGSYNLELELIHADGRRTKTSLGRQVYRQQAAFDVVLLLDSSESMKKTDPKSLRLDAVRTFLALARQSRTVRRIALVSFREETEVILPFCSPGEVQDLEARLTKLRPAKATNMDAAFETAADLLRDEERPGGVRPAVIFLSDGKPSVLRKYEGGHTKLHAHKCPAYTVALSDKADAELLRTMASETGGRFMKAEDARELESIFTHLFGLIVQPRTVYEHSIVAADREQFPLLLDPTMRNSILACASLDAGFTVKTEEKNRVTVPKGDLRFLSLHNLAPGSHALDIQGKGRMALRLTSSTPLYLDLMPLNRNAPRGLPLLCYAYLPNMASAHPQQISALVYGPDDKPHPATVLPDASLPGLFAVRCSATDTAGSYRLVVNASGTAAGMPFARRRISTFERIGEAVAEFDGGTPVRPATADELEKARSTLQLHSDTPITPSESGVLRTSMQCTPPRVVFDGLWPGDRAEQEIRIRFYGQSITDPAATPESPAQPDGILVRLTGELQPRGESVLAISVTASPSSAGRAWSRPLHITSSRGSWEIPLLGSVEAPRIVAALSDTRLAYAEETQELRAATKLQLHIEPHGRCRLRVATEIDRGELSVTKREVVVGQESVEVELGLSDVRRKDQDLQWTGRITVTGEGLQPTVLPYRLVVPAHAVVPAQPTQDAAGFQLDPSLLRIALVALAILLGVLLIVAMLQKRQRMAFVCTSALIHLAVLFLVLPAPAEPIPQDSGGGPPAVFPEAAVIAREVAPERSDKSGVQTSEAETVAQAPQAETRPDEVADASRRVTPEEMAREAEEPPLPRHADTELQRIAAQTRELADPVEKTEARRATEEQEARKADLANAIEAMTRMHPAGAEAPQTIQPAAVRLDTSLPPAARDMPAIEKAQVETRPLSQRVETQPGRKEILETAARAEEQATTLRTSSSIPRQEREKARQTKVERTPLVVPESAVPDAQELVHSVQRQQIAVQAAPELPTGKTADRRRAANTPQRAAAAVAVKDLAHVTLQDLERLQDPAGRLLKPQALAAAILRESALHARAPDPIAPDTQRAVPKEITAPRPLVSERRNTAATQHKIPTPEIVTPPLAVVQEHIPGRDRMAELSRPMTMQPVVAATLSSRPEPEPAAPLPRPRRQQAPTLPQDVRTYPPAVGKRQVAPTLTSSRPETGSPEWNPGTTVVRTTERASRSRAVHVASLQAIPAHTSQPAAMRPYARLEALATETAVAEPGDVQELGLKKIARATVARIKQDAASGRPQGLVLPETRERSIPVESRTLPSIRPAPPAIATASVPALPEPWDPVAQPDVALAELDRPATKLRKKTGEPSQAPAVSRRDSPSEPTSQPLVSDSGQTDIGRQLQFTWAPLVLAPDGEEPGRNPIGFRRNVTSQSTGRDQWRQRFPFVTLSDGDRSDRTAMINLAHQFETRTGSPMPYSGVEVDWNSPDLARMPFLFISGHDDFRLDEKTAATLRKYLQGGGFLWINDSTDIGDETFDKAVRREMHAALPGTKWEKIPKSSAVFSSPYDLRKGYRGYAVPPGDKYRVDYIEGITVGSRHAVIYTRNDYGDGLEIDARTHPLMASLTDLSPAEMQEGSVRMGINIVTYCLTAGQSTGFRMTSALTQQVRSRASEPARAWADKAQTPIPEAAAANSWHAPEKWDQLMETRVTSMADGLTVVFKQPDGVPFRQRLHKAVTVCDAAMSLTKDHVILVDIESRLSTGTRIALAFDLTGAPDYIETAPVFIRPGKNQDVVFDLGSGNLKSAETQWEYKASFPSSAIAEKIYLVILPHEPRGTINFSSFRLAR